MGRRRSKSSRRIRPAQAPTAVESPRVELVPWRKRVEDLLTHLRVWSAQGYGAALEAFLAERFGPEAAAVAVEDRQRAVDDYVCSPGSAGDGSSIVRVFADHASDVDAEDRDQVRRWETERGRGVFIVQNARRERLALWDPLEGAPLTLHLLEKLSAAQLQVLGRGTVVTATYQPWMARLVAVGVEFFGDPRALQLFREEVSSSGARWHEPPAAAPERTRGA